MVSQNLDIGDLVWAKMKGYPSWPGTIMEPPPEKASKSKKNHHYVYFFGSNNYAWIADESIELHSEELIEKYGKRKGELFHKAMETIIEYSKDISKCPTFVIDVETDRENASKSRESEKSFDKITNGDPQSKKKRLQAIRVSQKIKKKILVKKAQSAKKRFQEKKFIRKRKHSPDQNKPEICSESIGSDDIIGHSAEVGESSSRIFTFDDCFFFDKKISRPLPFLGKVVRSPPIPPERKFVERPITPPSDLMYKSEILKKKKIEPIKKVIGLLGLTKIGEGIAKNLYHSGHTLIIWNQTPNECIRFSNQLNVQIATTPAEVLASADVTFCCVSDSEFAKQLVLGDYGILKEIEHYREEAEKSKAREEGGKSKSIEEHSGEVVGKGFIEMTSIDPKVSQMIGTEIKMKGGRYLEAPLCGFRSEANEGALVIFASGDQGLYTDCKSCFDAISKKHAFVSAEVGTASKLNIVHNMVVGTAFAALAESLSLVDKIGIKGEDFFEVLEASHVNGSSLMHKLKAMVEKNYITDISLKQMQQEFRLGLALGHEISQRTTLFAQANEKYKQCKLMGYGDHDVSALFEGTKP